MLGRSYKGDTWDMITVGRSRRFHMSSKVIWEGLLEAVTFQMRHECLVGAGCTKNHRKLASVIKTRATLYLVTTVLM